jgi:5-methylcytosine-specific restriction endonuclease McrA
MEGARGEVLVLNQNYEPLNICSWQRAIALLYLEKAVVLAHDSRTIKSPTTAIRLPAVVRLADQVRRPLPEVKLSRASVMARDHYTCQYCGVHSKELTVDHVIPKEKGGGHVWDNVVACCARCNSKKGNRTVRDAEMALLTSPRRPRFIPYLSFSTFLWALRNEQWREYLEPFAPHLVPE